MDTNESLTAISKFIVEYSSHLMAAGVHTSRVVRNSKRIGEALSTEVKMSVLHKNIIITVSYKETLEAINEVIDIPTQHISFEYNSELSALSWEALDKHLSLEEIMAKYRKIVSSPMIHPLFVLLLVGFANASFCKLFGGDPISMGIVFSATITGFFLKQQMQKKNHIHRIGFCLFAMCIYFIDIRYYLRDSVGYKRTVSGAGCSAHQWSNRHCRGLCTDGICPPDRGSIAYYKHRHRAFVHFIVGKKQFDVKK